MHGKSADAQGGFMAMLSKDKKAHDAAVSEYFKHWDEKKAEDEAKAARDKADQDAAATPRRPVRVAHRQSRLKLQRIEINRGVGGDHHQLEIARRKVRRRQRFLIRRTRGRCRSRRPRRRAA